MGQEATSAQPEQKKGAEAVSKIDDAAEEALERFNQSFSFEFVVKNHDSKSNQNAFMEKIEEIAKKNKVKSSEVLSELAAKVALQFIPVNKGFTEELRVQYFISFQASVAKAFKIFSKFEGREQLYTGSFNPLKGTKKK